jgi:hypothetical protein
MSIRRSTLVFGAGILLAGCGHLLEGVGSLSQEIVYGGTTSTVTSTTVVQELGLVPLSDQAIWVNDGFVIEAGVTQEAVIRGVWGRGDGVDPYVQASRQEVVVALPGIRFPQKVPQLVTHISSQLIFDIQTGTLDVSTSAAFGLWSAVPYTVARSEGQSAMLRVGIKTTTDSIEAGQIVTLQVADGYDLTWSENSYVYELFCRTGLSEEACFAMAESLAPLEAPPRLPGVGTGG